MFFFDSQAIVSVTLKNKGEEAFRHDKYGDSITIERTINKAGNSSFKILSHDKKVVEKRKQEIEIMMVIKKKKILRNKKNSD